MFGIIGGGIVGLSTGTWLLGRRYPNARIVVLEKGAMGRSPNRQ